VNFGPQACQNKSEVLPTLTILFRPQSIAHAVGGINVAPHSDSKWKGIRFVCSSGLKPQKVVSWKC